VRLDDDVSDARKQKRRGGLVDGDPSGGSHIAQYPFERFEPLPPFGLLVLLVPLVPLFFAMLSFLS
jgi:hypothetical protein